MRRNTGCDNLQTNIVTLTTDFGQGLYVAQMKGVILGKSPDVRFIDVSHNVRRQNIRHGAYVLRTFIRSFEWNLGYKPVHICVVDPTVGSDRKAICLETAKALYIGPDNGVLHPAAEREGIEDIFEITAEEILQREISPVFHGRDLFAPAAAMLLSGSRPSDLGEASVGMVELEIYNYDKEMVGNTPTVRCAVLHIDDFGNVITSIEREAFHSILEEHRTEKASVRSGGREFELPIKKAYYEVPVNSPLITGSSAGEVEISVREGSAAELLSVDIGSELEISLTPGLEEP